MHSISIANGKIPANAHPDIVLMVRYWEYAHSAGRLPSFADFVLSDIPALQANIRLIDVVEGGPYRYRIREIGHEHLRNLGYDPRGSWYETVAPNYSNSIVELDLARVCRERRPVYRKGRSVVAYVTGNRSIERVHVPLSTDGYTVDGVATLTLFFSPIRPNAGAVPMSKQTPLPGEAAFLMPETAPGLVLPVANSLHVPAASFHIH
jgi:hypothetical protein